MTEPEPTDVLVVGSGASAVNAAWPLAEAGLRVRMLDYGNRDDVYAPRIPAGSFSELRRSDAQQHVYFLGREYEGIQFGAPSAGAQLTPPRRFVSRDTEELTPLETRNFEALESLAMGGLASAWGAACPAFGEADLRGMPIGVEDLAPHYEEVAARIGVSGAADDAAPFLGSLGALMPPPRIDDNAASILARYEAKRDRLQARGFYLGQSRLAMLTQPLRERGPTDYSDMEYWSDGERAVYRPRFTVEELQKREGFEYCPSRLVMQFAERSGRVEVTARNHQTDQAETHVANRLVLAAGALGTVRIVARSLAGPGQRFPLVCNPHTYALMINSGMLGRPTADARHGLAQLCFVHAPDGARAPTTIGHVYSYRSLLLFRIAREVPLAMRESLAIMRRLLSSLTILIVQHADRPTASKYCRLTRVAAGPDRLFIDYGLSAAEAREARRVERRILASFRGLGCYALRRVRPGHAASIHYAGTLPMSREDAPLTTDLDGRLRGTERVHVADGSVFPFLPSRGLTFTMMANANRIGGCVRDAERG